MFLVNYTAVFRGDLGRLFMPIGLFWGFLPTWVGMFCASDFVILAHCWLGPDEHLTQGEPVYTLICGLLRVLLKRVIYIAW